jgi:hypothetical protein
MADEPGTFLSAFSKVNQACHSEEVVGGDRRKSDFRTPVESSESRSERGGELRKPENQLFAEQQKKQISRTPCPLSRDPVGKEPCIVGMTVWRNLIPTTALSRGADLYPYLRLDTGGACLKAPKGRPSKAQANGLGLEVRPFSVRKP